MEATLMSIDISVDKDVVHTYDAWLLSHKKEWNNAICGNMNALDNTILSKTNHKERQILHDITYLWDLKYDTD